MLFNFLKEGHATTYDKGNLEHYSEGNKSVIIASVLHAFGYS